MSSEGGGAEQSKESVGYLYARCNFRAHLEAFFYIYEIRLSTRPGTGRTILHIQILFPPESKPT